MSRSPKPLALSAVVGALVFGSAHASALIWPSAVVAIERDLASDDVAVRRRAADRLSEVPGPTRARIVLKVLDDADVEVRLLAVSAGRTARVNGLGERVLGWLTEANPRLRIAAAEALTAEPTPRAVGPLVRALSDSESSVRRVAALALGASAAPEAVIGLLGRLDDSAVDVRENVVRALGDLGDRRAVVPLVSKIEDNRPSVRRAAAHALGALGDQRASSALVLALRDADASVRLAALDALGALGDSTVVPSVAAVLANDAGPAVRRAAIRALARIGGDGAVRALVAAIGSLSEERDALLAAFQHVGVAAAGALSVCLRSQAASERLEGCALALAATHAPKAGAEVGAALERGSIGPEAALLALADAADPETLAECLPYLVHADPAVRRAALLATGALLDPRRADGRAVEPLELAFERARQQRSERLELIRLLGRTGSPRAARLLVPIAERADDLEFRLAALSGLAGLGADTASSTLLGALEDPEPAVRLTAALSIRRARPHGIVVALLDRLERAAAQDRGALALALSGALDASSLEKDVARVVGALAKSRGAEREALIEALARSKSAVARAALERLSRDADAADRSKVAEVLALAGEPALLRRLAEDREAGVRQNAVWSLGAAADAGSVSSLLAALRDTDLATAANATGALARLARREHLAVEKELCAAVSEPRAAVRAGALAALHLLGKRCDDGRERSLLARDPSVRVRVQAARLLRDVSTGAEDARTLERCAAEEASGRVAAICARAPSAQREAEEDVLVFVVPAGESTPVAGAAFALERPDGLTRYGSSDRRGAVFEASVPDGAVELAVPAALDE